MLYLPPEMYPNPPQSVLGTPAVVFRDHRWTLPAIAAAASAGLLNLPVAIISFDSHRDSLDPHEPEVLHGYRVNGGPDELIRLVSTSLSPRDDDWIPAGMELGIVSGVVQFGIRELEDSEMAGTYIDTGGVPHRQFRLRRPAEELSWTGALVDGAHAAIAHGLWDMIGWDPSTRTFIPPCDVVLDIDLDAFTFSWERYTFAYTPKIFKGEYERQVQSPIPGDYSAIDFIHSVARAASLVTIATEPKYCGGVENATDILREVNGRLFAGSLDIDRIMVDYPVAYPDE